MLIQPDSSMRCKIWLIEKSGESPVDWKSIRRSASRMTLLLRTSIAKHAQAREIVVKLEKSRQEMVLRVIDDGIGLSDELKPKQGLGFHIMNYRAQLMGGRLEIDSSKHAGTRVSCHLPNNGPRSRKSRGRQNSQTPRPPRKP